jgi:prepilin-type N-terminal cleavage/methylation domain-containing protein
MKKSAFSLIEVSIAILIISILISGILQSKLMIKKSRLNTAQTLTKTSPVNDIENLVLWYETSLDSSFVASEAKDATAIGTWYDNNPHAISRKNATQSTTANKPKFYVNVFNDALPAVRFDGTNDYLDFDGADLINNSYTIFVVEQRRAVGYLPFIGGTGSSLNTVLVLGYSSSTNITQSQYTNNLDYTVTGYSSPAVMIHTFVLNTTSGKSYWASGGSMADDTEVSQTAPLSSFAGSNLGKFSSNYFNGDLGEIIIFNRSLKSEERRLIEKYLGEKYNITLS